MTAANDYRFIDRWQVRGTRDEVWAIMTDGAEFKRWWPGIYLDARELAPGDDDGLGKTIAFHAQGGRLLYTLHWQARTIRVTKPYGFTIEASGDFQGTGTWTFEQDGEWVKMTFEWVIRAANPLLRYLSFVIKPILANNHRWAMRVGERSLRLELARRHAHTVAEAMRIPSPPGPITARRVLPWVAVAAVGVTVIVLLRR